MQKSGKKCVKPQIFKLIEFTHLGLYGGLQEIFVYYLYNLFCNKILTNKTVKFNKKSRFGIATITTIKK